MSYTMKNGRGDCPGGDMSGGCPGNSPGEMSGSQIIMPYCYRFYQRNSFLPREAMQARPICCHAVSDRPSVRESVRHVRGFCRNV